MAIRKLSTSSIRTNVWYRSILAGNPSSAGFFYLSYYNHTVDTSSAQMATDGNGDIYMVCSTPAGAQNAVPPNRVFKQTKSGDITIQRSIFYNTAGDNDGGARGIAVNPNGEFFTHARSREGGQLHGLTYKSDAAGSLVAQRLHYMGNVTLAGRMGVGPSRVAIATDVFDGGSAYVNGIYAYDQNLSLQWHQYSSTAASTFDSHTVVDNDNNTYFFTGVANRPTVVKFNSAGTVLWQRRTGFTNIGAFINGAVDSSGNVYAVGFFNADNSTQHQAILFKYNSSGAILWRQLLQNSGGVTRNEVFRSVTIGADGRIYTVGTTTVDGLQRGLIACWSPSDGTLQWQRFFRRSDSFNVSGQQIATSGAGLAVSFNVRNAANTLTLPMTARLPLDGSLTGTYSIAGLSIVYEPGNLNWAGVGTQDEAGTLVFSQRTVTDSAASRTFPAVTNTNTLLPIG